MVNRRIFIQATTGALLVHAAKAHSKPIPNVIGIQGPVVISTWDFGVAANQAAWSVLSQGGKALDAVEQGARVPEADLTNHSVGRGGYPDREGRVSLDACIMDHLGNCGSVGALEHIAHPISVARKVMEDTPHIMLVGQGALEFAIEKGFKKEDLLTPEAKQAWKDWQRTAGYHPIGDPKSPNAELPLRGGATNHDTIGMLALDGAGQLAGACTTSGMAFKLAGRIGDSPIIGAGLYVDSDTGGATATGVGEEVIRIAGSFLVVELMRQGLTPEEACREALMRIVRKRPAAAKSLQVGFLAMNKAGNYGAYCLQKGFSYAVCNAENQRLLLPAKSLY